MVGSLAWTALVMGLVGGSHCLVMCAAPCIAITRPDALVNAGGEAKASDTHTVQWHGPRSGAAKRMVAYHVGRLVGYAIAGALIAIAMQSFSWLTQQASAFRQAWIAIHVAVMAWGLMMLLLARQPAWFESVGRKVWGRVRPLVNAPGGVFAAGLLWALMPCGLLYSAMLVAALSGTPAQGAITMVMFGVGSGLWLLGAPWAWVALRQRANQWRTDWGTRLGGLLLCGVAAGALWHDLVVRPSLICQ